MTHHLGQIRSPATDQSLHPGMEIHRNSGLSAESRTHLRANTSRRHGLKPPGFTTHPSTPIASLLPRPGRRPGMNPKRNAKTLETARGLH